MTKQRNLDKLFLRLFSQQKKLLLGHHQKSAHAIGKASGQLLSREIADAMEQFSTMYKRPGANQNQAQDDIDDLFEQTQELLSSGVAHQDVSDRIHVNEEREQERINQANHQKKLESIIARDKHSAKFLVPLMEGVKKDHELENRVTVATFCLMMLINILGKDFSKHLDDTWPLVEQKVSDDAHLNQLFQKIVGEPQSLSEIEGLQRLGEFCITCLESARNDAETSVARIQKYLVLILSDFERRLNSVQSSENIGKELLEQLQQPQNSGKLDEGVLQKLRLLCAQQPDLNKRMLAVIDALRHQKRVLKMLDSLTQQLRSWLSARPADSTLAWLGSQEAAQQLLTKLATDAPTAEQKAVIKSGNAA